MVDSAQGHDRFARRAPAGFSLFALLFCGFLFALTGSARAGTWQNAVALGGFNTVNLYTPDSLRIGSGSAGRGTQQEIYLPEFGRFSYFLIWSG